MNSVTPKSAFSAKKQGFARNPTGKNGGFRGKSGEIGEKKRKKRKKRKISV
jgi:hypothetical protein